MTIQHRRAPDARARTRGPFPLTPKCSDESVSSHRPPEGRRQWAASSNSPSNHRHRWQELRPGFAAPVLHSWRSSVHVRRRCSSNTRQHIPPRWSTAVSYSRRLETSYLRHTCCPVNSSSYPSPQVELAEPRVNRDLQQDGCEATAPARSREDTVHRWRILSYFLYHIISAPQETSDAEPELDAAPPFPLGV